MLDNIKKCMELIDRATKQRAILIALVLVVIAGLEAAGLGLVYAFVDFVLNPEKLQNAPAAVLHVQETFGIANAEIAPLLLTALIILFLLKNGLLLVFYYAQARFIALNEAKLAYKLLALYLHGAYALHLSRNSAEFIRNVSASINTIFSATTMGMITIVAELLVIGAIGTVLMAVEPILTSVSVVVLGTTTGMFFVYSRTRVQAWGRVDQQSQGSIIKVLQQGFHSIKEVKILGVEDHIVRTFEEPRNALAQVRAKLMTMAQMPRLWTETVVAVFIFGSLLLVLQMGGQIENFVSALTAFAAATFRLLPSMNRIILAMNNIKGGTQAISDVYNDAQLFQSQMEHPDSTIKPIPFDREVTLEMVGFEYEAARRDILSDVSFEIKKGESIGIVGPSGAGKTTLVDIIAGLLPPTRGRVLVDGSDIHDVSNSWRHLIGYVPQFIYLMDDTLRRNIAFGLPDDEIDEDRLANSIKLAQLEDIVAKLPLGIETTLGDRGTKLSGGQRQRIGIARALYNGPAVIIFDEATSALDSETEFEVNNAIQTLKGKKTLIVIAHRLSTVRQCDRLIYLKDGRVEGTGAFDDLAENNSNFRNLVDRARL